MKLFSFLNRVPEGERLALFARLSVGDPRWRHVGWLVQFGAERRETWVLGAEGLAEPWTMLVRGGGNGAAGAVVEFGIARAGAVPVPVGAISLGSTCTAESRSPSPRPVPLHHGGPAGLRSSWPPPHRLARR